MPGNNTYIYCEEKTAEKIRILNSCYPAFSQWEQRKARKIHKDMFGEVIQEGELYFRMRIDLQFSNDLKLSIRSMDSFLYAVFGPGPYWEKDAVQIIQQKMDKVRSIMDQIRPNDD